MEKTNKFPRTYKSTEYIEVLVEKKTTKQIYIIHPLILSRQSTVLLWTGLAKSYWLKHGDLVLVSFVITYLLRIFILLVYWQTSLYLFEQTYGASASPSINHGLITGPGDYGEA